MRYVLQLLIGILVWGNIGVVNALDSGSRESLRGMFGLGLVIEEVSPDASADGLSQEAIRTTVEQALRSKGIRLLTERTRSGSSPYLYINVNTLKEELGLYAYTVTVDLKQLVGLLSMKNKKTWGTTWSASVIGMVRQENVNQIITDAVEPLAKDFIDDFIAVNPR
ncbi:MAG: hypothetical protein IPP12_21175 [Nitrospira sp.]|jgi:hypothetical protein|uniref:Uncharacterized protein n=1 Tax=Candidatus Nitrospira nitrosa TaxID=1742972 RepID=A0A0S4LLJ0_9BACT|nr:DUF4136 domain-containing protein [Candidatus Nitrospira nitrosa]MBK8276424.1 hypothetical protein [Nitrospira sp.]MBK9949669.1 hypothetical protein [Nitrospira sp.]OYT21252.1 MAG: hypothetical protein CCU26_02270 [Nitrospira sp. UW-LDO-01]CUS38455.1 hypothetical protein COMA1_50110 [Candidatus Nitrospira nitrosa]